MKKILLTLLIGIIAGTGGVSVAQAAVSDVTVSAKDNLYINAPYTLSWVHTQKASTTYPVYLMGGKIKKGKFIQLGTTTANQFNFQFALDKKIKPYGGYYIQLGTSTADGTKTDTFKIKKEKDNPANKNKVDLTKPNKGTFTQGKKNTIKWKGGVERVIVGLETSKGKFVGWISDDEKPKSSMTWDAKQVCKIDMKTCWDLKVSNKGAKFNILLISKDKDGTYAATTTGNTDKSDKPFKIKPASKKKTSSNDTSSDSSTNSSSSGTTQSGSGNTSPYNYLYENTINYYNSVFNAQGGGTGGSRDVMPTFSNGIPGYFTAGGFNTYTIKSFGVSGAGNFNVDTQFVIFDNQANEVQQTYDIAD